MNSVKKYWFIIIGFIIVLIRFLFSYKMPSFYLLNLKYDDYLMITQLSSLLNKQYLGVYNELTLIKGTFFPICMFIAKTLKLSFSTFFTSIFILGCIYFVNSLKKIINNKVILLMIFILLLWNPVTYSSELFQRLYSNTICITELLFFLGLIINIITSEENNFLNYVSLGFVSACMILTRNDNIWLLIILVILVLIKSYKNIRVKNILFNCIPLLTLFLLLNCISLINYKAYGVYSYNELENSYFSKVYKKVLRIKDDSHKEKVAIPRTTFNKLCEVSKTLNCTKKDIDKVYNTAVLENGEIDNGNIIWFFRHFVYKNEKFKNGKEANDYFKKLNKELDEAFKKGKLKKEPTFSSIYINPASWNEIKEFPINVLKTIKYSSSYDNVKTLKKEELSRMFFLINSKKIGAYGFYYKDYRHAENLVKNNPTICEDIRVFYKFFTIILSIIALIIYIKNIKKKDNLNLLIHIILLIYLMIIFGIAYTHTTAFHAIRYRYLSNVYILQSLFILLNLYRLVDNKKELTKNETLKISNKVIKSKKFKVDKKVSVIIPAYNEENSIAMTVKDVLSTMKKNKFSKASEVIVVNDGSIDNTSAIALKSGAKVIDNPENMGYGFSLKRGIQEAKNDLIVTIDADGTYPFSCVPQMLEKKAEGYDLVIGARTGKYYKESLMKMILRVILKALVEFVSGKKIKDINSGLRVFNKSDVVKYFPRLCDTFSFSTSQTLAYLMNNNFVCYIDIPYNKRVGKTKVRLLKDSLRSIQYILEACIYYNPLKIFTVLTCLCIFLSFIGFLVSHFLHIQAGYILGIGGCLVSIMIFSIGLLAVLLKQIMDK